MELSFRPEAVPHPPEFLYFDLGNVLLHFDHRLACRQLAVETGISAELAWQIIFEGDLELRYERGNLSTREFFDAFCVAAEFATPPDFGRVIRAAAAILELNLALAPLVVQLRKAGHRMGVLSNTCEAHWQYVFDGRYEILSRAFDVYALSFELSSLKPEPEIYAAAARLAACEPKRIFFVDDRLENVTAAQAAGFDAVQFTTVANLAHDLRSRGVLCNY